eukprot:CAMPEP_0185806870 /NCGR_PEP_ID=MMETSP1322-20130828/4679_1 /TAXON_ID=265543 /ORGANISM="Minutocellus polymorphus, Strain RCC2270" /LENGTH=105 /DNA_ID=CAMNT_0028502969 /DNA_START=87 /DNA_END=401 /DNA_ORIENTATION=+
MKAVRAERQPGALVFVDWRLKDREESSLGISGVDACILPSLLRVIQYFFLPDHPRKLIGRAIEGAVLRAPPLPGAGIQIEGVHHVHLLGNEEEQPFVHVDALGAG